MARPLGVEALEGRALMSADDFGNDLLSALQLPLDETGSGRVEGLIEVDDDIDVFQIVAPADGLLEIRMEAAPGSVLDTFLDVADEAGAILDDSDDLALGLLTNSRVRFVAEAGRVYYARAQGAGASSGGYAVTFEGPRPIAPDDAVLTTLSETIEDASDLDLYRVVAPADGLLEVRLAGAPGGLDGLLTVIQIDGGGRLTHQVDGDDGARDGVLRIAAEAGRPYFLEVSAFGAARAGDYTLSLASLDLPSDPITAPLVAVPTTGPTILPASIEVAGDVDDFLFVAPATGGVTIRQDAFPGSGLDSVLSVFEAGAVVPIAANDDSLATRDSLVRITAVAGRAYLIRASGFGTSTGPYTLTIAPDDFGDDFDSAQPLTLAPEGSLVQTGTIDADGDVDLFRFVAPATGRVTLRQDAAFRSDLDDVDNALDSFAFAFDGSRRPIAFADDGPDPFAPTNSFLEFNVVEGRSYFVQAGAFPNVSGLGRIGDYRLSLGLGPLLPGDDFGNTVADALAVDLGAGFSRLFGAIETAADVDVVRVVAPETGSLLARQDPTEGSGLQAVLTAFEGSGRLIATNDDISILQGRTGSALQFNVAAGQEYFIQAAGFRGSTGAYDLGLFTGALTTPAPDDFGDAFATATPIAPNADGAGSQAGAVDAAGDVDAFQFTAPATGTLRIRLDAVPGSRLDPSLFAFDDAGSPLADNDDVDGTIDRNSAIELGTRDFPVIAGKTYFLKAAGFGPSTGRYQLSLAVLRDFADPVRVFDDVRDTLPADPFEEEFLTIDAGTDPSSQEAMIDAIGDVDVFRVVALASGTLTVQQIAAPGSGLDTRLEAYDGLGFLIASNNDDKGTTDSAVQFNVTEGQVYFLRAGAFGGFNASGPNVGPYTLLLEVSEPAPDQDVGDTFATALALPPDTPDFAGTIDIPGDVDVFRFTAEGSGPLTVRLAAAPGSGLDSFLAVFDGFTRDLIASNDDAPRSVDSLVLFDAQEGYDYFLLAAGFGPSTGGYLLSVLPASDAPFVDDPFAGARPVVVDPKLLTATAFGVIDFAGDADLFRFEAPVTGPLLIRQEATAGGALDSFLFVYDHQGRLLASNDDAGPIPDAAVVANVARGQTVYVRAASSARQPGETRRQEGAYRLVVSPLADDFGDTFDDARAVAPEGTATGTIDAAGDADLFAFVASGTGRLPIRLLAVAGQGLDPVLVAFDDRRNEIARNDDALPGSVLDSLVQLNVTEGRRYFLRASGYGPTAGRYELAFGPVAADDVGSDFASATPLALSAFGLAIRAGTLEDAEDVDVFRLSGPDAFRRGRRNDLQLVVELMPDPGSSQVADLGAFTILDGIPTQVAGGQGRPGTVRFVAERGGTYFLRVASPGGGAGGYRLVVRSRSVAGRPVAIREAGKATFAQLRESFSREAPGFGASTDQAQRAADAISADLVQSFRANLNGRQATDYLLLWLDPVDFRTTDPGKRLSGYTAGQGALNEQGGGFYSGAGALQLLITPRATAGRYSLELIGAGPDPVLFGALLIAADGTVFEPSASLATAGPTAGILPVDPDVKESLVVILDFPTTRSPRDVLAVRTGLGPARSSTPDRTIEEGLIAALGAQILAGGGLPTGPSSPSAGNVAATAGVVLTTIPLQLVPTGTTSPRGFQPGAILGEGRPREIPIPPRRVFFTLLDSLRLSAEPVRQALRASWKRLQDAVESLLPQGEPPEAGPEEIEAGDEPSVVRASAGDQAAVATGLASPACDGPGAAEEEVAAGGGSTGAPDPAGDQTAGGPGVPAPAGISGPGVPAAPGPVPLVAPVYVPPAFRAPWAGWPRRCAPSWRGRARVFGPRCPSGTVPVRRVLPSCHAAAGDDAVPASPADEWAFSRDEEDGDGRASGAVAFGVVATTLGLIQVHRPDGIGRRAPAPGGGRRPLRPARP